MVAMLSTALALSFMPVPPRRPVSACKYYHSARLCMLMAPDLRFALSDVLLDVVNEGQNALRVDEAAQLLGELGRVAEGAQPVRAPLRPLPSPPLLSPASPPPPHFPCCLAQTVSGTPPSVRVKHTANAISGSGILVFGGFNRNVDVRAVTEAMAGAHQNLTPDELRAAREQAVRQLGEKGLELSQDALDNATKQGATETFALVRPSSTNNHRGVYLYLDEVGLLKGLPPNPRANALARSCGFDGVSFYGDMYAGSIQAEPSPMVNVDFTVAELDSDAKRHFMSAGRRGWNKWSM